MSNHTTDSKNVAEQSDLIQLIQKLQMKELHTFLHVPTGCIILVCINDTTLGPALGGCRIKHYNTLKEGIFDVVRLSHGMSFKAAHADLELGGGKTVIITPEKNWSVNEKDRADLFKFVGECVGSLDGRYITAMDSGTTIEDMENIAVNTKFVASKKSDGNPSPSTAYGVYLSIKALVKHKLGRDDLNGLTVALQGVGNVGKCIAQHLHTDGAKLIVSDIKEENVQYCVERFGAEAHDNNTILGVKCDVLAPCALGAILTKGVIENLQTTIVCGCANNMLAKPKNADLLKAKGISYGVDYVVNSGGLIFACGKFGGQSDEEIQKKIEKIPDTLIEIVTRAENENKTAASVADIMAQEKITNAK